MTKNPSLSKGIHFDLAATSNEVTPFMADTHLATNLPKHPHQRP